MFMRKKQILFLTFITLVLWFSCIKTETIVETVTVNNTVHTDINGYVNYTYNENSAFSNPYLQRVELVGYNPSANIQISFNDSDMFRKTTLNGIYFISDKVLSISLLLSWIVCSISFFSFFFSSSNFFS